MMRMMGKRKQSRGSEYGEDMDQRATGCIFATRHMHGSGAGTHACRESTGGRRNGWMCGDSRRGRHAQMARSGGGDGADYGLAQDQVREARKTSKNGHCSLSLADRSEEHTSELQSPM